jgi:chromosome segregation ATPase
MTQKEELAAAKATNEELAAKLHKAEVDLSSANENFVSTEAEKTELSTKLENANAAIVDLNDKVTKLEAAKTELTVKISKIEGEAKSADERAREIAARTGTLVPKKDLKAIETVAGDKTMSRADFENLKHGERRAFIKGGGRLVNAD